MMVIQKTIRLRPYSRGYHIITEDVFEHLPELRGKSGILQVFIQHTSASLTINENADPSVRVDFESHFNKVYPENAPYYEHTYEGPDDMPAHLKASTLGASVSIPIGNGRPLLGTWQGIYLGEHRNRASGRSLVLTFIGE
ncbi:secondary thiamine-phosphate synthase enzyme YjbQ [Flammeovirga agarivorans]|uniref:YjbQ family protein n=2 Tax=Flammeovirga TaxID=59739 RepID=A0A7X8XVD9_9BACT|nr:YjbQ family protein [Flammeovirga agarivorans]